MAYSDTTEIGGHTTGAVYEVAPLDQAIPQAEAAGLGDRALVFTGIVTRYTPILRTHIYDERRLRPPLEPEDVLQDVFLKVWRKLHTFQPERASLQTWLKAITTNATTDLLRRENVRRHTNVGLVPEAQNAFWSNSQSAQPPIEQHETSVVIREALDEIPRAQSQALFMFALGFSDGEIAKRQAVSPGTAKGRLRLGKTAMRREFAARGFEDSSQLAT